MDEKEPKINVIASNSIIVDEKVKLSESSKNITANVTISTKHARNPSHCLSLDQSLMEKLRVAEKKSTLLLPSNNARSPMKDVIDSYDHESNNLVRLTSNLVQDGS